MELSTGSAALTVGLYAGSYAGLASGSGGDEDAGGDADNQRESVDTGQEGEVTQNTAVDSGSGTVDGGTGSWSGADFSG